MKSRFFFGTLPFILIGILALDTNSKVTVQQKNDSCHCDSARDSAALMVFRKEITVRDSTKSFDIIWPLNQPMSTWKGITLNEKGCVESLELYNHYLNGNLPVEIFRDLHCVKVINLGSDDFNHLVDTDRDEEGDSLIEVGQNIFEGSFIPEEISNLVFLEKLDLQKTNIGGVIPFTISSLTNLEALYLNNNRLEGIIPPAIGSLESLRELYLQSNQIEGGIPPQIVNLINLEILNLSSNSLIRFLPDDLGKLNKLKILDLRSNQIKGALPKSIGELVNLEILELFGNNFIGPVPETIGQLQKLKKLDLRIPSMIPAGLGNLINLEVLFFWENRGALPPEIGRLRNLNKLIISGEIGTIPPQIGNLNKLETLTLQGLQAPIPSEIGNLENLRVLSLEGKILLHSQINGLPKLEVLNLKSEVLCGFLPDSIGNLPNLEKLSLIDYFGDGPSVSIPIDKMNFENLKEITASYGKIEGEIPKTIKKLKSLKEFHVVGSHHLAFHTGLEGFIPPEICELENLEVLSLSGNDLLGPVLPEFENLKKLQVLDLGGNEIFGSIPTTIEELANLKILHLGGNNLSGKIPMEIGNAQQLTNISLRGNHLTGEIPPSIGNLYSLVSLDLSNNLFTDNIPQTIGQLKKLKNLTLSTNRLVGEIPASIGNLDSLVNLDLNTNQFTGKVPETIGQLQKLESLRLYDNKISGNIPIQLTELPKLNFINLSNNQLIGPVPANLTAFISDNFLDSLPKRNSSIGDIDNNRFTFDDILPNRIFINPSSLNNPQKPFLHNSIIQFNRCIKPIIDLNIDESIDNNSYRWYKNDSLIETSNKNKLDLSSIFSDFNDYAGIYTCKVSNPELPTLILQSDSIYVTTVNNFEENTSLIYNDTICYGEQIEIIGKKFDCRQPYETGTIINPENRCTTNYTIDLYCKNCNYTIKIPDVFTPNGDLLNETFVIPMIFEEPEIYGNNELLIYNQHKQEVFCQKDYRNEWNGVDKTGSQLPVGTYFYIFKYDNLRSVLKGKITIIR